MKEIFSLIMMYCLDNDIVFMIANNGGNHKDIRLRFAKYIDTGNTSDNIYYDIDDGMFYHCADVKSSYEEFSTVIEVEDWLDKMFKTN